MDSSTSNLALKFRPQSFNEVKGQHAAVKQILQHLANVANNPKESAQPLIFEGLHGTGKTTLARLVAKYLNCDNPTQDVCTCSSCQAVENGTLVDLIELDGASNNSVDDIRNLKTLSFTKPLGNFKVFILDEAHQISRAGANALLKTLEESPPRVIYILATTEVQKILPTILSRSLHIKLQPIDPVDIRNHIKFIVKSESFDVPSEILALVVNKAQGSMRDAVKYLYSVQGVEDIEEAKKILTIGNVEDYNAIITALFDLDLSKALGLLATFKADGVAPQTLLDGLFDYVTDIIHAKVGVYNLTLSTADYYDSKHREVSISQANQMLGALLRLQNVNFGNVTQNSLIFGLTDYILTIGEVKQVAPANTPKPAQTAMPVSKTRTLLGNIKANKKPVETVEETKPVQPSASSGLMAKLQPKKVAEESNDFF